MAETIDLFETDKEAKPPPQGELVVDLDGYEGPIDVLLRLAREQKVDLTKISILQLADQYLAFISEARRLSLEIAADYLVMAAWLAYLKSRLLLPAPEPEDEPSAAELAEALAFQLQRLEAMQQAGARLMARPLLGRDVFGRAAHPKGCSSSRARCTTSRSTICSRPMATAVGGASRRCWRSARPSCTRWTTR